MSASGPSGPLVKRSNKTQVSDSGPLVPLIFFLLAYGPIHEKTGLRGFANNKGADQPAQTGQHLLFAFWKVSYLNLLQVKFQVFC